MKNQSEKQGITYPSDNDVLSGRGNGVQNLHGNKIYRAVIAKWKSEYLGAVKTKDKDLIARTVYFELITLNPPARFLMKTTKDSDYWRPMDEAAALIKIKQALREDARRRVRKDCNKSEKRVQPSVEKSLMSFKGCINLPAEYRLAVLALKEIEARRTFDAAAVLMRIKQTSK